MLEAIRPTGEALEDPMQQRHFQVRGHSAAHRIWRAVKQADPTLPLNKGSREDRLYADLKSDLKDVADDALE